MNEISLSLLGDYTPTLAGLIGAFEKQNNTKVKITTIPWENAWQELLTFALYDRGPDVSHVGSTWASSLISMNALRPFRHREIASWGASEIFLPQCWQSNVMPGMGEVYAAPWSSYTFVLCYRRDLLAKAGLDETEAFASPDGLHETLRALQSAGIECPWVVPIEVANPDTLHLVASWVWGAGGDLIGPQAHLSFTEPAALSGFKAFYDLIQFIALAARALDWTSAENYFTSGKAAVSICGADRPYAWQRERSAAPEVLDHLGVAPMPGVPWIGGDSLVVWKHTRVDPARESLANELVTTLISLPSQKASAAGEEIILPTRSDAFSALPMQSSSWTQAAIRSLQNGRAYACMPMWSTIEHRFGMTLGQIGMDIVSGVDVQSAIQNHLDPLARRLAIMLSSQ
ncbi:MAG: extracellular solute-binding protein [Anaerolineales bacterium]|nr:extracellular solute-binding protein [Anaerolineales bacterium]